MNNDAIILLTEDDNGHATLIEKNLRRCGVENQILRFYDGKEILDYLVGNGNKFQWREGSKFIMILDIRMPKVNGFEVLRRLKEHFHLGKIPVIIISTSDNPKMIETCYDLGCSNYFVKPVDYFKFIKQIEKLGLLIQKLEVPRINIPVMDPPE